MDSKYNLTRNACFLGYIIQAVVNNLLSILFVIFAAKPYNIGQEQLGRLVFINFFAQLLIDYLSIYIVPKLGYRKCVVFGQASSALGFLMLGILPKVLPVYLGLTVSTLFLAMGSGLIEVLISPIMEALPGKNKARNMSLLHSFYCWGQSATIILSSIILLIFGKEKWNYLPFFWSLFPLINTLLFIKAPILKLSGDINSSFKLSSVFKEKKIFLYLFLMFAAGISELTIVQWLSFFTEVGFGLEKWVGDFLGPCVFAIFMGIGRVLYALIAPKISTKKILLVSSGLCFVCYITISISNSIVLGIISCGLCGLSVSTMWPGVINLATRNFKNISASLFSLLALFGDLGCAVGPWFLGIVSDRSVSGNMADSFAKLFNLTGGLPSVQLGFLFVSIIPLFMFISLLYSKFSK